MPHVAGHYESNPMLDFVYPYYEKNGKQTTCPLPRFPIIVINNRAIEVPKNGEVGFLLSLIPFDNDFIPQTYKKLYKDVEYFALAYDVVPWSDHVDVDDAAITWWGKNAPKKGAAVKISGMEDLDEKEMTAIKKTLKPNSIQAMIADQTIEYSKTSSFNILYKSGRTKPIPDWIEERVVPYSLYAHELKKLAAKTPVFYPL